MMVVAGIVVWLLSFLLYPLGMTRGGALQLILGSTVFAFLGYCCGVAIAHDRDSDVRHRRGAVVSDDNPVPSRDARILQLRVNNPQPTPRCP